MMSNARAQMAGSGGVTTDSQAQNILGKIGRDFEYNALSALYDAERDAEGLRDAAKARRYEGKVQKRASRIKALSTAISGGMKAYDYGTNS